MATSTNCNKCGRPMVYAKENKCNYCDSCMSEYCGCKLGRIKEIEPTCDSTAVIPSITVESVEGITNLANCLVHVEDINTTFYVDDKHRVMITWAGPVNIPGYDMENNPNGYRDQIVTDIEKGIAVIYDKHGKGFTFGIEQSYDITEIINNKLDEMAASGELEEIISIYLNSEMVHGFDTAVEMKSSEALINGSYARTLGYYNVNDGGEALYRIVETEPEASQGVYYETLDSGLFALLIPEDGINVKQFGLVGDGNTDDTSKFGVAVNYGAYNNLKISLNSQDTYYLNETTTVNLPDNELHIEGNNSTLSLNSVHAHNTTGLDVTCKNIVIRNLNINGNKSIQDQFDETNYRNLAMINGFVLRNAKNIELYNLDLQNWYGNAIRFYYYKNISINNVNINNVGGHWHEMSGYDAFGDAFTFSRHEGDANINIENVNAVGKYKGDTLSRIGMTFGPGGGGTADNTTSVNLSNCNFINYDRGIHTEGINGHLDIRYNNGTIYSNVAVFTYNGHRNDQVYFNGNNLKLNYHNGSFGSSHGIYNTTFDISNSIIDCSYVMALGMFEATGTYDKCVFNNVNTTLFTSNHNYPIIIKNSTVNLGTLQRYLCYKAIVKWENCVFNSEVLQVEPVDSTRMLYGSCVFNNFRPFYTPTDLKNEYRFTDHIYTASELYSLEASYLYNNDVLVASPNISGAFPLENLDLLKYVQMRTIGADPIALIPTTNDTYLRPNSKYLLISLGNDGSNVMQTGKDFNNYYYNVITTDASSQPTIGTTGVVGTPSGVNRLTIDEANNTVSRVSSNTARVGQWLLPYYYKDYLKNFA